MVVTIIKNAFEKEEIENQERKKEVVATDPVTILKLYTSNRNEKKKKKRKKKDIAE